MENRYQLDFQLAIMVQRGRALWELSEFGAPNSKNFVNIEAKDGND